MKTTKLLLAGILVLNLLNSNAQATQATNAPLTTSYLGTSSNLDVMFKRQAINAGLLSASTTSFGVSSTSTPNSVSFGVSAGQLSSGQGFNTYIGHSSGIGTAATSNSGSSNTFLGYFTGAYTTTGSRNTFVGSSSGRYNASGNNNTFIGSGSGCEDGGGGISNSVYIGYYAGFSECASNRLIIGNGEDDKLIWGDFALDQLKLNAKVGIGVGFGNYPTTVGGANVSNYNLFVKGGILTEEVRVNLQSGWADYVFANDYKLRSLNDVENFINTNGHLPNVPSAKEVSTDGIEIGNMSKIQLAKIEELTLYIIQQNKRIEALEAKMNKL